MKLFSTLFLFHWFIYIENICRQKIRCWPWKHRKNYEKRRNPCLAGYLLFSSPEHNVLKMSYHDRSMSVCPWTITLKIFSSETGQQISMKLHRNDPWVMHFHKTSKIWIPWRTLVAMATDGKNFKNLFVPKCKG